MKKDFRYDAALLSRASFPAVLEADDRPCIVEITVYRLNAVAVTSLTTQLEIAQRFFVNSG